MTAISKHVKIAAPVEKVWAALTDPKSIRGWMGEDSTIEVDLQVGGGYRVFGGETTGDFTEIKKPNTLAYTWRQGEWPKEWADSVVRWELKAEGKATHVHLTHDQFPSQAERDSHDEGWDVYWLEPMKAWLEGGTG